MNKAKIKIEFCIKTTDELDKLSHKELLKYIKKLQKNIVQDKPKKNSDNSSIAPSTDINKKKKNQSLRQKSDKPDEIITIAFTLEYCKKCDSTLDDVYAANALQKLQRVILKQAYEKSLNYLLTRPVIPKSETDK